MAQGLKRGGPEKEVEEESDPMFVIKNLDTGLQMKIDDFDKIANLTTDERQEQEQHQKKGGLKFKGSKAIKTWTAETTRKASAAAKKAVSGIKDVAQEIKHELKHELNAANVLSKHKLSRSIEPSPSKAASLSGAQSSAPDPGDELIPRSTTAESSDFDAGQSAGSLTSIATSEPSATTSQISQQQQPSSATAAIGAEPAPIVATAAAHTGSPLGPFVMATPTASLGSSQQVASTSAATAGIPAASTATAAAAPSGPAVPAAARLVSHKRSVNTIHEVVLAQVLEGSIGVVWAVAFSRDGSFLATAGQDGVLRIWQLTACRDKEPRTNWVYTTSTPVQSKRRSSSGGSQQDQVQQQQQQQQDDTLQQSYHTSSMEHLQQQGINTTTSQQQQLQPGLQQLQQHAEDQDTASQSLLQQDGAVKQSPVLEQQPEDAEAAESTQQGNPPIVEFGPYLSRQPVRIYTGHTEDILDVSWSAGSFILTASVDKTVRLWHVSQPECLREFWHTDFVTSVQFHPLDAQRFVSGSIDGKINVWSITENAVLTTAQLHQDMVTAVAFSLNGGRVLAGTMRGRCRFYELADRKLEYVAQVDVRNQRGAHACGKKVTGICAVPGQPQQFLITTNDSRLRLLEGYGQILKFKGHRNMSTQLRASISADGSEIVCGSDDGWVYVWQTGGGRAAAGPSGYQQQHRGTQQQQQMGMKNAAYQAFHAHDLNVPVTAVACAPAAAFDGRLSVLGGAGAGGSSTSTTASRMVGEGQLASVAEGNPLRLPLAAGGRGPVQQLVVSGALNGAIRVHELL